MDNNKLSSSFRDPSGFLFSAGGKLYRQVNWVYRADYDLLLSSGLYKRLVAEKLLIPHKEVDFPPVDPELSYKIIEPQRVGFISYPYEWCFSQYKNAALVTLKIQKIAMEFGMSLKDASAYNIQFHFGNPVIIDTLSFEKFVEGKPWVPYRQFCQHFLAPLSLMALKDIRLGQLMRVYIDGIPIDLASKLLPVKTRLNLGLVLHIHTHASVQKRHSADQKVNIALKISQNSILGLLENLEYTIRSLRWKKGDTEWGDYYNKTNYSEVGLESKDKLIGAFIDQVQPKTVWDLGANTGHFCRIITSKGIPAIAFDIDPIAVENGYLESLIKPDKIMLNLMLDLTNPSPAIGWNNNERMSLQQRGPVDVVMALALIHHLAISNNVPLDQVAKFFAGLCSTLIIEFVPKSDSQVKRLLSTRLDVFPNYCMEGFEQAFRQFFDIRRSEIIPETERTLYLMEKIA